MWIRANFVGSDWHESFQVEGIGKGVDKSLSFADITESE